MSAQPLTSTTRSALLPGWLAANITGWLLAFGLMGGLWALFAAAGPPDGLYAVAFVLAGAIIGLAQWRALGPAARRSGYGLSRTEWLVTTTAGFGIGLQAMTWANLLDLWVNPTRPGGPLWEWDPLIGALLAGLAVGFCQALAWRRRPRQALAWFLAAGLGWSAGLFLPDLIEALIRLAVDIPLGTVYTILWLIVPPAAAGLVTGLALNRLPADPAAGADSAQSGAPARTPE
jgi:hypothetical protein